MQQVEQIFLCENPGLGWPEKPGWVARSGPSGGSSPSGGESKNWTVSPSDLETMKKVSWEDPGLVGQGSGNRME